MLRYFVIGFLLNIFYSSTFAGAGKCETCKDFVEEFQKAIDSTKKANFGGGNTNWEEKNLGKYLHSETRLLEVLDKACKDDDKKCHAMLEEHEEDIENWWFKHFAKGLKLDLHSHFCVDTFSVCCPSGTFGAQCKECTGGRANPCRGAGKCNGDGTRKGTGSCDCNDGYQGATCDACSADYFQLSTNDTHTVCLACDKSCKGGCTEDGPQGCNDCKEGWTEDSDVGCVDIDECQVAPPSSPCSDGQYCSNTVGSYVCLSCNAACSQCTGPADDVCVECAQRYYRNGAICTACHESCESSCTDSEASSCDTCKAGWTLTDGACTDVDECTLAAGSGGSVCQADEHCVNTVGSYRCSTCHSACNGCVGAGADQCIQCKAGYSTDDAGLCRDIDECSTLMPCTGANQKCINTIGTYRCECAEGFILKGSKCVAKPVKKVKPTPPPTRSDDDEDDDEMVSMEGAIGQQPPAQPQDVPPLPDHVPHEL